MARTAVVCVAICLVTLAILQVVRWMNPEPVHNGKRLSAWLADLQGINTTKAGAIAAFESVGPEAIPFLSKRLTNDLSAFERAATNLAVRLPKPFNAPFRQVHNTQREHLSKLTTLDALTAMGTNGAGAAPVVNLVLRQPAHALGLRSAAARTLAKFGPESVPHLVSALDDPDFDVRSHACYALSELGPSAAPALPRLALIVSEERGPIAAHAAGTLARIGPEAVPVLVGFLTSSNVAVRKLGIGALVSVNAPIEMAVPSLIKALTDESAEVRHSAYYALSKVDSEAPSIAAAFVKGLEDSDESVREAAAQSLMLRPRITRANLSKFNQLLEDEAAGVRAAAAMTVGQTGHHGVSAVPGLKRLLNDTNELVRAYASNALDLITRSVEIANASPMNR